MQIALAIPCGTFAICILLAVCIRIVQNIECAHKYRIDWDGLSARYHVRECKVFLLFSYWRLVYGPELYCGRSIVKPLSFVTVAEAKEAIRRIDREAIFV